MLFKKLLAFFIFSFFSLSLIANENSHLHSCLAASVGESTKALNFAWYDGKSFIVFNKSNLYFHSKEEIKKFRLPDFSDRINSITKKYAYAKSTLQFSKDKSLVVWLKFDNKTHTFQLASTNGNFRPEESVYSTEINLKATEVSSKERKELLDKLIEQHRVGFSLVRKKLFTYFDLESYWEIQMEELKACRSFDISSVESLDREMRSNLQVYKRNKTEVFKAYSLKYVLK